MPVQNAAHVRKPAAVAYVGRRGGRLFRRHVVPAGHQHVAGQPAAEYVDGRLDGRGDALGKPLRVDQSAGLPRPYGGGDGGSIGAAADADGAAASGVRPRRRCSSRRIDLFGDDLGVDGGQALKDGLERDVPGECKYPAAAASASAPDVEHALRACKARVDGDEQVGRRGPAAALEQGRDLFRLFPQVVASPEPDDLQVHAPPKPLECKVRYHGPAGRDQRVGLAHEAPSQVVGRGPARRIRAPRIPHGKV